MLNNYYRYAYIHKEKYECNEEEAIYNKDPNRTSRDDKHN